MVDAVVSLTAETHVPRRDGTPVASLGVGFEVAAATAGDGAISELPGSEPHAAVTNANPKAMKL
jgi:hypothetical protein